MGESEEVKTDENREQHEEKDENVKKKEKKITKGREPKCVGESFVVSMKDY